MKQFLFHLGLSLLSLLPMTAYSQVVINEFTASNRNNYATPGIPGEFDDWIELYNTSATPVNIDGYWLSDDPAVPMQYQIPAGVTVPANGRRMFFLSGEDALIGGQYHTNFKITQTKGDYVVFSDPTGVIIDSSKCYLTQRNHSRGRTTDGAATWGVFTTPTPNAANTGASTEYMPWVMMNTPPGFYAAAQNVTLTCSDPTAEIRYTTNGSVPTAASTLYTGPINVATTTVIRAAAFPTTPGYLRGFVETNTYFINAPAHEMAVISVSGSFTNPGLFSNGQEIVSTLEYFDESPAHNFQHEGDGDMRRHGNDSWAFPQKGMRFFPRDQYGYENNVEYKLFKSSARDEFSCIILKAGASDNYPFAQTQNGVPGCHMRDALVQTLALEKGMHLDGRRYEPCVLYVNGQYWGLYEIRERLDKDFTEYNYNQSRKDVDIIRYWGGIIIDEGSKVGWDSLYNFVMANNMAVPANYQWVKDRLDLLSVIDHLCFNTFINNSDWINWNSAWWRGRKNTANTPPVKWKYWMWDQDNVFDLGENYTGLPSTSFQNGPCGVLGMFNNAGPNMGHLDIFRKLMDNPTFKSLYINRASELFTTALNCDTMDAHYQRHLGKMASEMPRQIARWGGSMAGWQNNCTYMRNQWLGKCGVIDSQYVDCFEVTGPHPITIDVLPAGSGNVIMNTTYTPPYYPYIANYYGGVDMALKAVANTGYIFDYWTVAGDTLLPGTLVDSVYFGIDGPAQITAHFRLPMGIVNNDTAVCGGISMVLACTGGSTYAWSTTANPAVLGNAATLQINPTTTTSYICTTDIGADTVTITVNAIPVFSLGQDRLLCDVPDFNIVPTFSNPPLPSFTYTWQDNSNGSSFLATTTGQYYLTINNNGCIGRDTINVVLSTTPSVNLGADQHFCDGTPSVNLNAGFIPTATYTWQDGSSGSTLTATQDGLYWVIVNNQGCIDRDSVSFIFSNQPTVNFGPDQLFCDGTPSVLLNATSFPSATYTWQNGSNAPTLNATADGTYWVHIDNKGCKAGDTVSYVFSIMPTPNLGADVYDCIGLTSATLDAGFISTATYLWQDGSQQPTYYVSQTGSYWVRVDNKGCVASDSVYLYIGAYPVVDLGPDRVICPSEQVKLSVEQSNVEVQWQDGSQMLYYFVTEPGTYHVAVVSNAGCATRDTITFSPSGLEDFSLGDDREYCYGDTLLLTVNVPSNATYTWNNGLSNEPLPITKEGTYSVLVRTPECKATDDVKIKRIDCENCFVFVPSAFSPNGDLSNDKFYVRASCPFTQEYSFKIFDRMGSMIWASTSPSDEWDGTVKGVPAPEGVYTYHIVCKLIDEGYEKPFEDGGTITLLR